MALYQLFSVSLIPVYDHRTWYFPVMGSVKRGWRLGTREGGCMYLNKEGDIKKGDKKRKEG